MEEISTDLESGWLYLPWCRRGLKCQWAARQY